MLIKLIKQINWKDILYVSLFNSLMKISLLSILNLGSNLPKKYFFLLVLSTIFILIGGNLAKVFFDVKEKTIPKNILLLSYIVFFFLANIISFYVRVKTEYNSYFLFVLLFTLFIFFYSEFSFKKSFLNNIIEAFLITFAIIIVWWFDPTLNVQNHWKNVDRIELVTILFVALTFIANLVKNILKDFTTIKEDKASGFRTLPVALGEKQAKKFLLNFTLILLLILSIISIFFIRSVWFGIVLFTFSVIPTYFFHKKLSFVNSREGYLQVFRMYYAVIFLGMIVIPLVSITLKYIQ